MSDQPPTGPAAPSPPPSYSSPSTPPYGGSPGWGAYPAPYGPPPPRTNTYAIASLVCSLAGLVTGISAIAGIVLGHIALKQIQQTGEEGRTLAIAGLAIGYGLVVLGFLIFAFVIAVVLFGATMAGISTSTTTTGF